jgi:hypothetical protein
VKPAQAGARGYPPKVIIAPYKKTKKKKKNKLVDLYERCYESKRYRQHAPGVHLVPEFWDWADPFETQTVIDYGAGTGRAGYELHKRGLNVTMVDFAKNCLDEKIAEEAEDNDSFRFILHDLTKPLMPEKVESPSFYGFCTDFMEHIPEKDVDEVLDLILLTSKHVYFRIACVDDQLGSRPEIKDDEEPEPLHLCVHRYPWWLKKFVDRNAVIHRSEDQGQFCTFYVTAYNGINLDVVEGRVNVEEEKLIENVKYSASLGLPSIMPFECQETEIMLICGGPSLNDFTEEITQNRKDGMKLVTVNGSYQWAMAHGLKPSLQILIDAREFNKRFTEQSELSDETKFVVSSSSDPAVFENLPPDRTWLIHTSLSSDIMDVIEKEFGALYAKTFPIPGGCTVALRSLAALRMMGFYKIHVYGFDSCLRGDEHHAYEQAENNKDSEDAMTITVAPGSSYEKEFRVAPWMIFQAMDFKKMAINLMGDVNLNIKGDGLIAYMVETGAKINKEVYVELEDKKPGNRLYIQEADRI